MANTRLINPIHNLTKTAYDIAYFLRQVTPEKYIELLKAASETYGYSYLCYWRKRVLELNAAIEQVKTKNSIEQALTWFHDFINAKDGGWEDSSANVILLRQVIKRLDNYDSSINLSLEELRELKGLLLVAITDRIDAEEKVNAEKQKLDAVVKQREALEQEMLARHDELIAMKDNLDQQAKQCALLAKEQANASCDLNRLQQDRRKQVIVIQALRDEIEVKQKEVAAKQKEAELKNLALDEVQKECDKKQQELEDVTRTLLSPAEWQAKKVKPQDMQEAKKVAETAVNIYVLEKQAAEKKAAELKSIPKHTAAVKEAKAIPTVTEVSKRYVDMKADCEKRSTLRDAQLKKLLEERYRVKSAPAAQMLKKAAATVQEKKSVSADFAAKREQLGLFYKAILPAPNPADAIKPATPSVKA